MNLADIPRFLLGSREVIERLASSRTPLIIGPALVLSASLARNYDGAAFPQEAYVLLHGFGASIINAFILHTIFYLIATRPDAPRPPFFSTYLSFLGLFWLTSPMAWLYAIPYERFLTVIGAINLNIFTLGIISIWRVGLICYVISILYNVRYGPALCIILFFSNIGIFIAAITMETPVVHFMGGLQHSSEDYLRFIIKFRTMMIAFFAMLPLLIAAVTGLTILRNSKAIAPTWPIRPPAAPSRAIIACCAISLAMWTPALWIAQPEQHNRYRAESLINQGRYDEALAFMSQRNRTDFPRVWDAPPDLKHLIAQGPASLFPLHESLQAGTAAPWVRTLYLNTSWNAICERASHPSREPSDHVLEQIRIGADYAEPDLLRAYLFHADHNDSLPQSFRDGLREIAAPRIPEPQPTPPISTDIP